MKRKIYVFILIQLLLLTSNQADGNKAKEKNNHSNNSNTATVKNKINVERIKRSLDTDEDEKPFWANRGKKQSEENYVNYGHNTGFESKQRQVKYSDPLSKEPPFWGNRGRRDDSTENKNYLFEWAQKYSPEAFKYMPARTCKFTCKNPFYSSKPNEVYIYDNFKQTQETPYWETRDRRNPDSDYSDKDIHEPFWGNRGRRVEEDSPFWGNRGRRNEEESSPFWGNRGRRQDENPFWGARGRRDDPFWGARGRREESDPFWGNRGKREDDSPFWGNRGKREDDTPFWGNRGRRKENDLKEAILNAIHDVEDNIIDLSNSRRSSQEPILNLGTKATFWENRNRDSKMKYLFNGKPRTKFYNHFIEATNRESNALNKLFEPNTYYNEKVYAEQPHFILVDRASRSASFEDDPYIISRGKKKTKSDYLKSARDRRGIIEEIVKSVKSDPYYIARGKKTIKDDITSPINYTLDELSKTKNLICSTIDLMNVQKSGNKTKRDIVDSDRDRRTILKKLAAQLQMDPYFVSRGKKDKELEKNEDYIEEFIRHVAEMCS